MLSPAFQDLIKPQWRGVLETLKRCGGLPVGDLAEALGVSYMAAKSHCEALTRKGYLQRTRLPRTEVGRPEIFYSLTLRAEAAFVQVDAGFTLELLDDVVRQFGQSAPRQLLFKHFERQRDLWAAALEGLKPADKVAKLAKLRAKAGHSCCAEHGPPARLVEWHHPLHAIIARHPDAVSIEVRMLEELLGGRVTRSERQAGPEGQPTVVFELA
jgi:predicted ArsR family transcriptional regulator